ncbi:MAG TPA: MarR family winged helix-turn-helix transcriptional regulator [Chthoniobacteraceae bacterium]|nr:MarR family winged helix-turn-helix transcriptional regulator [Chthoniobacteraceae bacterium]
MPAKKPPASASVTQAEYETLASFRHTLRQFLHFSETAARDSGIAPQQHQALLAIRGFSGPGPITIAELAGHLQVRHHSAVGLVDRLVKQKLVKRTREAEDRRRIHLALTARGDRVLGNLSALHKDQIRRIIPGLTAALRKLSKAV